MGPHHWGGLRSKGGSRCPGPGVLPTEAVRGLPRPAEPGLDQPGPSEPRRHQGEAALGYHWPNRGKTNTAGPRPAPHCWEQSGRALCVGAAGPLEASLQLAPFLRCRCTPKPRDPHPNQEGREARLEPPEAGQGQNPSPGPASPTTHHPTWRVPR